MAIRKPAKSEWHRFFDGFSTLLQGMQAEIEVATLALGDQIEAEWLPIVA